MVRKLAHSVLNVKVARSYVPYQDLENKAMLMGFLESPNDFINHIRRYTTSLTTQMTFGYRTPASDDPNLVEMFDVSWLPYDEKGTLFDKRFQNFEKLSELAGTQASTRIVSLTCYGSSQRRDDHSTPG